MPRFNRLRMSSRSQNLLALLKSRTGLTPNITGRFAICLSLNDPSLPNPEEFDERGSEIHPSVLFGEYEDLFRTIMLQRLVDDGLDSEIYLNRMVRAHFNRGTIALFARVHDLTDFDRIVRQEREAQSG
jgi:DNA sulfur modification protein DndE